MDLVPAFGLANMHCSPAPGARFLSSTGMGGLDRGRRIGVNDVGTWGDALYYCRDCIQYDQGVQEAEFHELPNPSANSNTDEQTETWTPTNTEI